MKWFLVALFTTAAAFAAGQSTSLPDGEGKALVNGACVSCHGADLITGKTASKKDWTDTVDRMRTYGATLSAAQATTLIDYLAASFGPKAPQAPIPAAGQSSAGDAEGKALVTGLCSSCHGDDLITSKKASRKDWQDVIDRMKSYGASITPAQNNTLLEYLVKNYGTKEATPAPAAPAPAAPPAAADAGKKILEDYCGGCHDVDLATGQRGTQSEWQDIVDRMNGRGAGVPDKDIPVLVQYLTKTYPAQN